jgi:hypothetical protein
MESGMAIGHRLLHVLVGVIAVYGPALEKLRLRRADQRYNLANSGRGNANIDKTFSPLDLSTLRGRRGAPLLALFEKWDSQLHPSWDFA